MTDDDFQRAIEAVWKPAHALAEPSFEIAVVDHVSDAVYWLTQYSGEYLYKSMPYYLTYFDSLSKFFESESSKYGTKDPVFCVFDSLRETFVQLKLILLYWKETVESSKSSSVEVVEREGDRQ